MKSPFLARDGIVSHARISPAIFVPIVLSLKHRIINIIRLITFLSGIASHLTIGLSRMLRAMTRTWMPMPKNMLMIPMRKYVNRIIHRPTFAPIDD